MDQLENPFMRKSQIRPPSRIPSPGKGLAEISDAQGNARLKPASMLPPPKLSSSVRLVNDVEPKRKTLAERAGEPARLNGGTLGRSTVKGTSLVGAGSNFTSARNASLTSSTSSRAGSTRTASNSSFSSSTSGRPQTSFSNRTGTFSQSTSSRPKTSMASKRPASSMDEDDEETGPDGKRKAWDVRGRLEDMEAMYSELKDTMAGSSVERQSLEQALGQFKSRVMELESKNAQLESRNNALQSDLDITKQRLASTTTSLEDESRARRIEKDDLQRESDRLRRDMTEEIDRLNRLQERELSDEVDRAERGYQKKMAEQAERLEREYRDDMRDMERRNNAAAEDSQRRHAQELQDVRSQIAVEQQNLDAAVGGKDREIQNMRGELEDIRGELDREQTLKGNLQRSVAELRNELLEKETKMAALHKSMHEHETIIASLRSHVTFLESGNKAQSDSFASLDRQLQEARASEQQWKTKLIKEETLRRSLFNQVQELKGNIRVMCRVRPGAANDESDVVASIRFPDIDKESKEVELQGPEEKSSLGTISRKINAFSFDRVFGPETQNEEVFGEISQLVQSALDGYNVCIFCYGQTGAGKTYTMSSPDGMIPRATAQIYDSAEKLKEKGWTYSISGEFVEVYNEEIHDLLGNSKEFDKKKHEIRHDEAKKTTTVSNLTTIPLDSPNTVEMMLKRAANNRSVAATKSNERSSRSHSIFILKLFGKNSTTNETSEGILNLVDLAGSERLKQSGAEGDRMKETQNINKSLSSLGNVIDALGQGKQGGHVPYRDSKLTYLLKNSLGGNSKTLMFVMISPLEVHVKETLTSLNFATKVHNTHIGTAKKSTKVRDV